MKWHGEYPTEEGCPKLTKELINFLFEFWVITKFKWLQDKIFKSKNYSPSFCQWQKSLLSGFQNRES